jgi:hypothetical protein
MAEDIRDALEQMAIDHAAIDKAHAQAAQEAILEHAWMGRSVCESRDGKIVWIPPEEIFARYGLDANGKPIAK